MAVTGTSLSTEGKATSRASALPFLPKAITWCWYFTRLMSSPSCFRPSVTVTMRIAVQGEWYTLHTLYMMDVPPSSDSPSVPQHVRRALAEPVARADGGQRLRRNGLLKQV